MLSEPGGVGAEVDLCFWAARRGSLWVVSEGVSVRARDGGSAVHGWQSPPLVSRLAALGVAAALVPDLPSQDRQPPTTFLAVMSRALG